METVSQVPRGKFVSQSGCGAYVLLALFCLLPNTVSATTLNQAISQSINNLDEPPTRCIINQGGAQSESTFDGTTTGVSLSRLEQLINREPPPEDDSSQASFKSSNFSAKSQGSLPIVISASFADIERDQTENEAGYTSQLFTLIAGSTVPVNRRLSIGASILGSSNRGDYEGRGDFSENSAGLLLASYFKLSTSTLLSLQGGYLKSNGERNTFREWKRCYGAPSADYLSNQFNVTAHVRKNFEFSQLTVTPSFSVLWKENRSDTYAETDSLESLFLKPSGLELVFYDHKDQSLQTAVGVQVSIMPRLTGLGDILPTFGLTWFHELENDRTEKEVSFVGDSDGERFSYDTDASDRDFLEARAGIVLQMNSGFRTFLDYNGLYAHRIISSHSLTIGVQARF